METCLRKTLTNCAVTLQLQKTKQKISSKQIFPFHKVLLLLIYYYLVILDNLSFNIMYDVYFGAVLKKFFFFLNVDKCPWLLKVVQCLQWEQSKGDK